MGAPGRDYAVLVQAVSVSAAQDLFEIGPADDKPTKFMGLELGQYGVADYGDAQAEGVGLAIRRGNTASGSGGSSPTVRACDKHDAAAGFTAEANNTTKANTSGATFWTSAWNVQQSPSIWWWPDNTGISSDQGDTTACVELIAAPADALTTVDQTLFVREF